MSHLNVLYDADGILYIGFNDHVKEAVPRLAERLNNAGFKIEGQQSQRLLPSKCGVLT